MPFSSTEMYRAVYCHAALRGGGIFIYCAIWAKPIHRDQGILGLAVDNGSVLKGM